MTAEDLAIASKATDYWEGFLGFVYVMCLILWFVFVLDMDDKK